MKKLFYPRTLVYLLALLLPFLMSPISSHAGEIAGSEFSYVCSGTPGVYIVTLKLYRNCAGAEICSSCPSALSSTCAVGVSMYGATAPYEGINYGMTQLQVDTFESAMDVVQLCSSAKSACNNCGKRSTGTFSPGIEIYTFRGMLDLRSVPSCEVKVAYTAFFRNSLITVFASSSTTPYYNDFTINKCLSTCDNSPVFTAPPALVVCAGQDLMYSFVTSDPDGDSLSYHLGTVMSGLNQAVQYNSPYSSEVPFAYLGAPIKSPPALPPVGISIDAKSGDLRVRPFGYFVAPLVLEIRQWKMVGGVYQASGKLRRDIELHSVQCPSNFPPTLRTYDHNKVVTIPQPDLSYTDPTQAINLGSTVNCGELLQLVRQRLRVSSL